MRKDFQALALAALLATPLAASAIQIDFYNGNGASAIAHDSIVGGVNCGQAADVCGTSLGFDNLGGTTVDLTVTADVPGNTDIVFYDQVPDFGGLGAVGAGAASLQDNIIPGESVILEFSEIVALTDWTAFNHADGAQSALGNAQYNLVVDGASEIMNDNVLVDNDLTAGGLLVGQRFEFTHSGNTGAFYISAFNFRLPTTQVSEPFALMLTGIGMLVLGTTRRRG